MASCFVPFINRDLLLLFSLFCIKIGSLEKSVIFASVIERKRQTFERRCVLMRSFGRLLPWLIALGLVVLLAVWVFGSIPTRVEEQGDVQAGVDYLNALEAKDPAQIVSALRQREADRLAQMKDEEREAQRQELIRQIDSGEVDIWSRFEDYVILGDSRAVGFYYFDFLDKNRVLADGGHTIRDVEPQLEAIKALQPRYIYLCYGLNDVSIGYWDTEAEYVEEFMKVIDMLHEALPDALVVVSSILPARDPAFELSSRWRNIPSFSAALKAACEEKGVPFADNDSISETYAEYWQPDGIHVRPEFYPYWATNLILTTIEGEANETESNTP